MSLPERPFGEVLHVALDEIPIHSDATYPIAGVYGFGRGLFQRGPITGTETSYPKLNRLAKDRLVISRLKAFEGALAVVPPEFDGWYLSPEFPTFDIDPARADKRYIANLCSWPELWARLGAQSKGVGARKVRVNADRLMTVKVPLPDLPEQRRIATRLDAAVGKFRKAAELRQRRKLLRLSLAESTISAAAAESTTTAAIGSLVSLSRKPLEIHPDEDYRAFGMRSFGKGSIRYEPAPGKELSKLRYFDFPAGALVISNIKAWEGAIGVTGVDDAECVASNRFLFYMPADARINISYLRHYLLSRAGLAQVSAASPGSADRNRTLSIKRFEVIQVPLPTREVQDNAARLIDTVNTSIDYSNASDTWNVTGASLLNAAFSGQL